jgi:hypothetical protein
LNEYLSTLTPITQDVERFAPTLHDARTSQLKNQQLQQYISNDLATDQPAFHFYVNHKAFFHDADDEEYVTLVNSGVDPIDIPIKTLLLYTNNSRKVL